MIWLSQKQTIHENIFHIFQVYQHHEQLCVTHFMPLISFYTPWKHEKTRWSGMKWVNEFPYFPEVYCLKWKIDLHYQIFFSFDFGKTCCNNFVFCCKLFLFLIKACTLKFWNFIFLFVNLRLYIIPCSFAITFHKPLFSILIVFINQ